MENTTFRRRVPSAPNKPNNLGPFGPCASVPTQGSALFAGLQFGESKHGIKIICTYTRPEGQLLAAITISDFIREFS